MSFSIETQSTNEYENEIIYSDTKTDIKPIVLYLPQYHTFPENDRWWGAGFTEWTNVKKARPVFDGHYQPRVPHEDIGYYTLDNADTLRRQAELAKRHGIYGFGIYYYWFSGTQLMKKPMELLLSTPDIEMPFFLIWANENWTRAWDGNTREVLIEQQYAPEDAKDFIIGLKKYMEDARYIRMDGKPVIGLYAPKQIPNLHSFLRQWRDTAYSIGIGEIYILICASDATAQDLGIEDLVDGEYEFPPRLKGSVSCEERPKEGVAYNYRELVEMERGICPPGGSRDFFRGAMLNWDNAARRKNRYNCWSDFSFEAFYLWLKAEIAYSRKYLRADKRFVFINAWNEWGEGTYLEPDARYGYRAINTLSKAVFGYPYENRACMEGRPRIVGTGVAMHRRSTWAKNLQNKPRVAVQAHVFYEDLIALVTAYTNHIPVPFDLYITTDCEDKAEKIETYVSSYSSAVHTCVEICENRGRDVIPLLVQMEKYLDKYDYLCHIHTKKSNHASILGDIWRDYLYENLLGSKDVVSEILDLFETNSKIGLIMPENLDLLSGFVEWGSNKAVAKALFSRMKKTVRLPENEIIFPAGNMFWMRTRAVRDLFDTSCFMDMIPEEKGQIDGTLMHAIERCWIYLAEANGYSYQITRNIMDNRPLVYIKEMGDIKYQDEPAPNDDAPGLTPEQLRSMIREIASVAGVRRSVRAVGWAACLFLRKVIAFLPACKVDEKDTYAPKTIARTIGLKNSIVLVRMAFGFYLQK